MKSEGRESAGWGFVHGLLCAKMSLKHPSGSGRLARRLPLHCLSEINVGEKSKEKVHSSTEWYENSHYETDICYQKKKSLHFTFIIFPFCLGELLFVFY